MEKKVIEQFYHEHPLILTDDLSNKDSLDCYVCGHPITNLEKAYVCIDEHCSNRIILHKKCGELPSQISHYKHPQHPLHLFDHHKMRCWCDLCCRKIGKVLGYRCLICRFYIDINCEKIGIDAWLEEKKELKHQSHPHHPLTLMRKPALSFYCDGCGVQDVDMAYVCSVCEFWVHKSCALLPQLLPINRQYHHHPLHLAFSFPAEVRYTEFWYKCDVCDKRFDRTCWLYFCRDCRFFAHIKCVASTNETPKQASLEDDDNGGGPNVIQLPLDVHDMYKELITPFVMREKGLEKIPDVKELPTTVKMEETTAGFSRLFNYHKHPLSLVTELSDDNGEDDNEEEEEEEELKICDVCVTPISSPPYYECAATAAACKYFVHSMCYLLPKTLSSSSSSHLYGDCPKTHDKTHKFTLYTSSESTDIDVHFYCCMLCNFPTNGRVYECGGCKMKIDIKCASLPTTIRHAFHRHHKPLTLCRIPPEEEDQIKRKACCVCRNTLSGITAYCCNNEGCDYALDLRCALRPQSVTKKEWDDHPLLLTSDASLDHPSDFYCDFCEKEMNPKWNIYHCRPCDHSFHLPCLKSESGGYRNIKFGRRFELDGIHPHPLTYNHVTLKKWCDICPRRLVLYNYCGYECASCYFAACGYCVIKELYKLLL